jgi:hypothetical protein
MQSNSSQVDTGLHEQMVMFQKSLQWVNLISNLKLLHTPFKTFYLLVLHLHKGFQVIVSSVVFVALSLEPLFQETHRPATVIDLLRRLVLTYVSPLSTVVARRAAAAQEVSTAFEAIPRLSDLQCSLDYKDPSISGQLTSKRS